MIKFIRHRSFVFILTCLLFNVSAQADIAPNYERESRLADQIVDDIFDGEPLWLNANSHSFLTIHTPNEENSKGTVIILHGRGYHPDWPEVVAPLRTGLLESGWSTLSVQMPVLDKGKTYFDYLPIFPFGHARIQAAITHIQSLQDKDQKIVLAAHSCGAHMANDWLNHFDDSLIDAYIIMSAGATDYQQENQTPFPFAKMSVPILDLYGAKEFPRPLAMVPARKALLNKGGNIASKQIRLENADHYFHEQGDALTGAVDQWLKETFQ